MKSKNYIDFIDLLFKTKNQTAEFIIDLWLREVSEEEWRIIRNEPMSYANVLAIRNQISRLFAWHIQCILDDFTHMEIIRSHAAFIDEFHQKAWRYGFMITEKRILISPVELSREKGFILWTANQIFLTPKGRAFVERQQGNPDWA